MSGCAKSGLLRELDLESLISLKYIQFLFFLKRVKKG